MKHDARLIWCEIVPLRLCLAGLLLTHSGCGGRTASDLGPTSTSPGSPASSAGGPSGTTPPGQRVVLFGGQQATPNEPQLLADTWEWDGSHWTQRNVTGPSARCAAAFANLNGRVVVFGGQDGIGQVLGDTWEWDGTSWTEDKVQGPSPRGGASAATLNGHVVLFGGAGKDGLTLNDTWLWDGSTWQEIQTTTAPSPREGAAIASLNGQVVMYGGTTNDGYPVSDTWAWDGRAWTLQTSVDPQAVDPRFPPSLRTGGLAAAAAAGKVFLLGGLPTQGGQEVMWTWAPPSWVPLNVAASASPSGRIAAQVATLGDDVVLFGGGDTQTWTWDGTSWSASAPDPTPQSRVNAVMSELE